MEHERHAIGTTMAGHPVHFSREERQRHVYVVGKSGSGKSTVLFNLAMLDITGGEGVAVIDPHGDLAEAIANQMPRERMHEVCYLDVSDLEFPVGFNPLAGIAPARQALAASGMVSAFKHLWRDFVGSTARTLALSGRRFAPRRKQVHLDRFAPSLYRRRLSRFSSSACDGPDHAALLARRICELRSALSR